MDKKFKLAASEIKQLISPIGGCIATDMITVQGQLVGYMYREEPSFESDSGWRFTAGVESEEFMDDPDNHAIYDVNTICNYDPSIIPLLETPFPVAFERDDATGDFVEVECEPPRD